MPEELPSHQSAVRTLTAKSAGREYRAVRTLSEAQAEQDFAVILEGDYGGQIYLTCPVERLKCTEQSLRQLLLDIDAQSWEQPEACGLYFEHAPIGTGISSGMGGGIVSMDVWIHDELHELGLAQLIIEVINGNRNQLDAPSKEELESRSSAGDACAQYLLAHKIRHVDPKGSLELLRLSAAQGNLGAMSLVYKGNMPPKEKEFWLIEIAQRTDCDRRIDAARSQLADAYVKGSFGTIDHQKAVALYRMACERRWSASNAFQLGKMCRDGLGVQQNNVTALMWFLLSSVFDIRDYPHWRIIIRRDRQPEVLESMSHLKSRMSSSEVNQAEQLSANYFKNSQQR